VRTKSFAGALAIIACAAFAVPSSAYDGLPAAVRAWLTERPEIVFVGQASYPPFEFLDERTGEYTGMSVELIRWIATEYGFSAVFKPMPFEAAQSAVLQGEADALTGLFKSDARSLRFDFSTPVFSVPASIYTRNDGSNIRSAADLNGKRIAAQRGDYAIEHLASAGITLEWVFADDFGEAIDLVATGAADAIIGDEQTVRYYLRSRELEDRIHSSSGPLYAGADCMAVAKGDAFLLAVLDAGIERAKSTGTLETIYRKWTGSSLSEPTEREPLSRGAKMAILVASIAAIFSFATTFRTRSIVDSATRTLKNELEGLKTKNDGLTAANARLRLDLEERSRLEEDKRRIDAEAAARRVEELTRCAIAKALDTTASSE
jgi:ABC-type amino acid transport substrate-binding protein